MSQHENRFLKVSEAAKLLGVAPNTLRNWSESGKVQEYRHPLNNYRLYKKSELDELSECLCQPKRVQTKRVNKKIIRPR
jgi:MerR family transcriptional regulator, copper efflux regulator